MAAVAVGARRPAVWFALLVPGVLAAGSLPISALVTQPSNTGMLVEIGDASLTKALYLGDGPPGWPIAFLLGWYWTGVLALCVLLTAAWCRRSSFTGRPASIRGYLVTGSALVAATVALPLAGWTTPVYADSLVINWLDVLWQHGTFAQLGIAVTLGILAGVLRSYAAAVAAASYAAAVCLAGWVVFQGAPLFDVGFSVVTDPYLLPAAVLLVAGLGALLAAAIRALRAGQRARASDDARPAGA